MIGWQFQLLVNFDYASPHALANRYVKPQLNKFDMHSSFKCEWVAIDRECGLQFKNPNECYEHVRRSHINSKTVKCRWSDCSSVSRTRCNLTNHILIHIPIVSGICYLCNETFKRKHNYRKHKSLHTDSENRFNDVAAMLFK